ncbi:MAG: aminotransferase class V-fold PLP-dependent enzyme [Bacteroidales bacterium]|nr:MAG: aminotransferase class V-fold PLP-dependent enzyme [Bacteroidales bacterium]
MKRRTFLEYLAGVSAMSVLALNRLNASTYANIASLNRGWKQDESPDGAYWDAISKHFIFQDDLIMMNNGTLGPIPEPVFNTLMKYFKVQATNPYDCYNFFPTLKDAVRNKLARFIGASPDEVAVNRNTTEGMNLIANGLDLKEGDEVLITSHEHPAGYHPWKMKEQRYGITVTEVPLGAPPKSVDEIIGTFEKHITEKTKVISVSHTVYITGLIFPLKELSELAHSRDILVAADSAHGMGMIHLNARDLGIDLLASSPYKWCGAPTGCGLLFVRKEVQDRIWPTIATSGWENPESASRFETLGQRADPLIFALGEAMDFQNSIGRERIERRVKTLAKHLKEGLETISGVRLHTSGDPYLSAGLTAFSIEGVDPETIVNYVREKYNIVIRTIGRDRDNTRGVRVSTHIYLNTSHVDMLLEGVKHLAGK